MILSFGYTAPALLAGAKTVTRRDWKATHADRFKRLHVALGWVAEAYDRSTRVGGHHIADILVQTVQGPLPVGLMPDSDYEAEGFAWLHANGHTPPKSAPFPDFSREGFDAWRRSGAVLYVVRFELVRVLP